MNIEPVGYYNSEHGYLKYETDKDCYCSGGCNMIPLFSEQQVEEFVKPYKESLQEMYDGIADLASPIGLMETYPGSQEANYAQYFIHERSEEMFNKLKWILEVAK